MIVAVHSQKQIMQATPFREFTLQTELLIVILYPENVHADHLFFLIAISESS